MTQSVPLVGRDHVLSELRQALTQAEARRGQLVLVSGEPGIGKSTLADIVGREAGERGAAVVFGRAWELAEAPPYFPVWSGLRALGLEPPKGAAPETDAFHLWERVLEGLARASAGRAFVWILEDLHAADLLTLDLLSFLARPLRALGVLLLVTMRDRDPRIGDPAAARLARLCRDGRELRLDALDPTQVKALAEAVAGRALEPAAVRQLAELTGGNPLFLIECARNYRQRMAGPLPASIRALTTERVALLPESTREALACGAVVGRDFTAALVARMQDGLPAQVIERLSPALRAGILVEPRPGQFRFSHILVRDAVEDALGPTRAAELHARAAEALTGEGVDVLVERARHALAAMRPEGDPVGLALRAAGALTKMGAADRAFALYQRLEDAFAAGLEAARPSSRDRLHRAAVARAAGQHGEARRRCLAVLAEARAARDLPLMGEAALELGAELRPGIVDTDLVAALRETLALDPGDPALRCRLEARLAAALQPAEDPSVPVTMGRAAITAARSLGDPALLLEALHTAGSALVDYAPIDERLALAAELRDRAGERGDVPRVLLAHARLAMDHAELGDFGAFDADVRRLRDLSAEVGHPRWRSRPLFFESMRALMRGDFETSDRCVVEVQQQAGLTDDPTLWTSVWAHQFNRAVLFHREPEIRAALPRISEGMVGVPEGLLWAACIRGGALARLGDTAGATAEMVRIRPRLPSLVSDLRALAAEVAAVAGTREDRLIVRGLVAPLVGRQVVSGHVPVTYEGPWSRVLALLDLSLGDHAAAIAGFNEALAGARRHGHAPWVAQLSYDLGRALAAAGRTAEAAAAFEEARAGAEALGMPGLAALARAPLHASAPAPAPAAVSLSLAREGEVWRVEAGARSVRVRHSRGMELLARLVERPGEELHVLALASDAGGALVEGDAGELLDAQARREYRARLDELEGELAEAEEAHDLGRQARLAREREALEGELSRAVGLGGRARPAASATERARVNVQRRLKDAVARVSEANAELGAWLTAAVHTGTYCCFRP
jgi:tetratricopeptide (TPR) repeat protein